MEARDFRKVVLREKKPRDLHLAAMQSVRAMGYGRWSSHSLSAGRVWPSSDPDSWAAGLFLFLAIRASGAGTGIPCDCARFAGSRFLRMQAGPRFSAAGNREAPAALSGRTGNRRLLSAWLFSRRRGGHDGGVAGSGAHTKTGPGLACEPVVRGRQATGVAVESSRHRASVQPLGATF